MLIIYITYYYIYFLNYIYYPLILVHNKGYGVAKENLKVLRINGIKNIKQRNKFNNKLIIFK